MVYLEKSLLSSCSAVPESRRYVLKKNGKVLGCRRYKKISTRLRVEGKYHFSVLCFDSKFSNPIWHTFSRSPEFVKKTSSLMFNIHVR